MKLLIVILTALNFFTAGNTSEAALTTLNLKLYHQGFYRLGSNDMRKPLTVTVSIYQSSPPYTLMASSLADVEIDGNTTVTLNIPANDLYWIAVSGWNIVETWSKTKEYFTIGGTANYDFSTSAAKAFGDNMIKIDYSPVTWGIYTGDINLDGYADLADLITIQNAYWTSGNINTDLNGDEVVESDDLLLISENEDNEVTKINP